MCARSFGSLALACWLAAPVWAQQDGGDASAEQAAEASQPQPDQTGDAAEASSQDESDSADAQVDPTGTWTWERDFGGNRSTLYVRIKGEPRKLSGSYQMVPENAPADMPAEFLEPTPLSDVTLKGDTLSFTVVRNFNDNEFVVDFEGTINGDELTGQVSMDFGGDPREFPWNAKRVVAIEDVVGKWTIGFETPQGPIESAFTIANEDGKLQGTYHSQLFGDAPMDQIALKDKQLSFVVNFGEGDRPMAAKYKAEPRGDRIKGVIGIEFGGELNETPFTGEREQPAQKEKAEAQATPADTPAPQEESAPQS